MRRYNSRNKRAAILRDIREAGTQPRYIAAIAKRRNCTVEFVSAIFTQEKRLIAHRTRRRKAMQGAVTL